MRDWLLAIAILLGATVYLYADSRLPQLAIGDPMGPRAFPALIGIGLLLSGLLLILETWRKRAAAAPHAADAAAGDPKHLKILLALAAWTALYYVAFEPVGYLIATPIYLFALLAFFNPRRWLVNSAVALGFTASAYGVFAGLLNVQLPGGLLGS